MKGKTSLPPTVIALAVVSLLHDLAGDMVTPLLPALVATMGGGPIALGVIEGTADATAAFLKLVSGHLADRVGRLKVLTVSGYAVANLLRPLLALATTWWQVLLVRFGDRIGKGLRGAPRDAMVAAVTPPDMRGRAFGFHHAMESLGAVGGPLAAYLLLHGGTSVRAVIAWSTVPGLLTMIAVSAGVAEPRPMPASTHPVEFGLPPGRAFRRLLLAIVIFTLGNSSDAFLLWRASEVGVPVALAPILWMMLHVARSLTGTWGGILSDRRGRRFAIAAGWSIYAASYVGFAVCTATWQVWILFGIYGIYYGLTEGAQKALVVDLVPPAWRGRALGAFQASIGLAALPASVLFGLAYRHWGAGPAFGAGAVLALIASMLLPRTTTAAPK